MKQVQKLDEKAILSRLEILRQESLADQYHVYLIMYSILCSHLL